VSGPVLEVVWSSRRRDLERASALLARHGIRSRHSRPRRAEGILRVPEEDAERARELLRVELGPGGIVAASEAAWFRCFACRRPLSLGAVRCPACDAFVGDPHGG